MRILSFLLSAIILCSCSEKKQIISTEKKDMSSQKTTTAKKLLIQKVGELRFRKSYSGSAPDNKWTNPWGYENHDTSLLKKFQEILQEK